MDERTIEAYSTGASHFAAEWREQPPPADMYALLQRYFTPGGKTADIGCGAGRDVAWLNDHGFPAVGYDAAEGLLAQAATAFPSLVFRRAALPALESVGSETFDNVLCETVIMHLPHGDIAPSVPALVSLLKPNGILYLSWRVTKDADQRDKTGRLYASFDTALVRDELKDMTMMLDEDVVSASSGKIIHRIVARR